MFAECGSWKNFTELEDELTLEELSELYAATIERNNRFIRVIAMAMGAELGEEPGASKNNVPLSSEEAERVVGDISGPADAARVATIVGGGLGYETVPGGSV